MQSYSGAAGQAEQALAPIRRLGVALSDTVQAMDYTAVQRSGDFDDPRALGMYIMSKTARLERLGAEVGEQYRTGTAMYPFPYSSSPVKE